MNHFRLIVLIFLCSILWINFAFAKDNVFFIDKDRDGYGVGEYYLRGPDADDNNPSVNNFKSVVENYESMVSFLKKVKGYHPKRLIYISKKGNDDSGAVNDIKRPFRWWGTVQKILQPGDVVIFREGAYFQKIKLKKFSGTPGMPVIIMACPGEKVVFNDCGNKGNAAAISLKGGGHIIVDGICFQNHNYFHNGNGIYLNGATNYDWYRVSDVIIRNIEVRNTKSGIRAMMNIHNLLIEDCVVHDTSSHNIYIGTRDNKQYNSNIIIRNNILYNAAQVYKGRFCIQHNGIVDKIFIEQNICHSCQTGGGVSLVNGASNSIIENNLIFNNSKKGIQLWGYGKDKWGGDFAFNEIKNNIIWVGKYNSSGSKEPQLHSGILLDSSGLFKIYGTTIKKNIICTQSGYAISFADIRYMDSTKIEGNLFFRQDGKRIIKIGDKAYKLSKVKSKNSLAKNNRFAKPPFKDVSIKYYSSPQKFDFDLDN